MITGLLPPEVLSSGWFEVLATFVAINTLVFAALSLAKLFPPLRRGRRRGPPGAVAAARAGGYRAAVRRRPSETP